MARAQQTMCAVSVGFDHFLLPMSEGLKLVGIMQKAVLIEPVYGESKTRWEVNDRTNQADLKLSLVRSDEIRMREAGVENGMRMLPAPRRKR
jgi:hypothetical protein